MTREEVIQELDKKLTDAKASSGFFITVTAVKGDKLLHYQCRTNIGNDDVAISLISLAKNEGIQLIKKEDILPAMGQERTWN